MEPQKSVQGFALQRRDFLPYLLIFVSIFLMFSLFSFREGEDGSTFNWFGRLGHYISFTLLYLMGKAAFLLAGFCLVLGVLSLRDPNFDKLSKALFFPLFLVASSVSLFILESPMGAVGDQGGIFGQFFSWILNYLFGETGRIIVVFFMYIYFGVIWLEDSAWTFFWSSLNKYVNQVYKWAGGTKELPSFRLPSFFTKSENFAQELNRSEDHSKSWFEVKTEKSKTPESILWGDEKIPKDTLNFQAKYENSEINSFPSKQTKVRYKNTSLFEGFFDAKEESFRFHSVSPSLYKKYTLEDAEREIRKLKYLDLRTLPEESEPIRFSDVRIPKNFNTEYGISDLELPKPKFSYINADSDFRNEEESTEENFETLEDYDLEEESNTLDFPLPSEAEIDSSVNELLRLDVEENLSDEFLVSEENEDEGMKADLPLEALAEVVSLKKPDFDELELRRSTKKSALETNLSPKPEEQSLMFGSLVPKLKLKKGKYYISPRLLAEHSTPPHHQAKFDSDLDRVSKKIEEGIGHFGIESKVISRERGPIITRYEITIPNGIKLSRIVSLSDELRAYLEVKNIRIVAPIPGKSTIGIEVPNRIREDVFLSEILKDNILQNKTKDLSICIGKDISGKMVMIDLAKLPHLLVAGTTGSGKSVSLNAMITSLICTRSPEEVRFIMIDPKMVEMSLYEGIPHLLMPVITDPKKATKALSWAIQEMESRYQMISQLKSRDFKSFNDKVDEYAHAKGFQKLPYIVIFIDELADLMMVSGKDLEEQIQRISQKARAVGIHLVMATQRPSVDVITGVIKANCPARAAFQVAQKTDSRTILDTSGAESLLGKGDFLYRSPTSSDLMRIQAPFIEEKEIETIVEEAKKQGAPAYVELNWEEETSEELVTDEDEELFSVAWNIVLTEKKASASYLQRRMRIGYNKAARLMELMEIRGYVSAQIGAKPREILRSA